MTTMTDLYVLIACYIGVAVLTAGVFAWLLRGFLGPFLVVKLSRGKKVLVRVRGLVRNHFHPGVVVESTLTYKGADKQVRKVNNLVPVDFQDIWGVRVLYIDETSSAIIKGELARDTEVKGGHDPVQTEQLIIRALTKPMDEDMLKKIIIVLMIFVVLVLLFNSFMLYKMGPVLQETLRVVSTMNTTIV